MIKREAAPPDVRIGVWGLESWLGVRQGQSKTSLSLIKHPLRPIHPEDHFRLRILTETRGCALHSRTPVPPQARDFTSLSLF